MFGAWFAQWSAIPDLEACLTMYLATLDCANSNPSLGSSPVIRQPR